MVRLRLGLEFTVRLGLGLDPGADVRDSSFRGRCPGSGKHPTFEPAEKRAEHRLLSHQCYEYKTARRPGCGLLRLESVE